MPCILSGWISSFWNLRLVHHVEADLLHRLAQQLDVGVDGERQVELHRRPVAAEVGDVGELAERHDVSWPF